MNFCGSYKLTCQLFPSFQVIILLLIIQKITLHNISTTMPYWIKHVLTIFGQIQNPRWPPDAILNFSRFFKFRPIRYSFEPIFKLIWRKKVWFRWPKVFYDFISNMAAPRHFVGHHGFLSNLKKIQWSTESLM